MNVPQGKAIHLGHLPYTMPFHTPIPTSVHPHVPDDPVNQPGNPPVPDDTVNKPLLAVLGSEGTVDVQGLKDGVGEALGLEVGLHLDVTR